MTEANKGIIGGDERLRKSAGSAVRGNRESADLGRTSLDGTILTSAERRRMLRDEWVQEVLPTPPVTDGWHYCWLSTTSSTDPIFKRQQLGYQPVLAAEIPGFESYTDKSGGSFDGCISCNEMVLFKIDHERWQDIMMVFHHDLPLEQETGLRETVEREDEDRNGVKLGSVEGDGYKALGKPRVREPNFSV